MIYASEPFICRLPGGKTSKQVTTVFKEGPRVLSICCDNSCGALRELFRSDIRAALVFGHDTIDVTGRVFGVGDTVTVPAKMSALTEGIEWVNFGFPTVSEFLRNKD